MSDEEAWFLQLLETLGEAECDGLRVEQRVLCTATAPVPPAVAAMRCCTPCSASGCPGWRCRGSRRSRPATMRSCASATARRSPTLALFDACHYQRAERCDRGSGLLRLGLSLRPAADSLTAG
ncbi:hypothetical protein [Xanthomonas hyacinthi]|uniref:hypothetical protein n=1 Tax=Xanthomonas hyacinthi TaxID=56455 RepID=UPI001AD75273|nr:hypothetical protein [Xanthomonas hyacinthi]